MPRRLLFSRFLLHELLHHQRLRPGRDNDILASLSNAAKWPASFASFSAARPRIATGQYYILYYALRQARVILGHEKRRLLMDGVIRFAFDGLPR